MMLKEAAMDTSIEFRPMKPGDEISVFIFISDVFHRFVAPEFSQKGIEEFLSYIQPDALVEHLKKDHFGLIASDSSKILGVIVVRNYYHVALFFVDSQHQHMGIGRALLSHAIEQCRLHDVNTSHVTVNASPNSIKAYERFNFKPTGKEQCINGIRFVPMSMGLIS